MKIFLVVMALLVYGCSDNNDINHQINLLLGTEIKIPNIDKNQHPTDYTIVNYVDSIDCVPCRIKLDEWKELVDSLNGKVRITFIAHPDSYHNVIKLFEATNVTGIEVVKDSAIRWKDNNQISKKENLFNTLLLDSNMKVIVCGSPFISAKMMSLYKKHIEANE